MLLAALKTLTSHKSQTYTKPGNVKVKTVKQSCNRPGVAQRVPGGLGSQISMTFST
jgi:hypothetical protein